MFKKIQMTVEIRQQFLSKFGLHSPQKWTPKAKNTADCCVFAQSYKNPSSTINGEFSMDLKSFLLGRSVPVSIGGVACALAVYFKLTVQCTYCI